MIKNEALKMAIEALKEANYMVASERGRLGEYDKALQACKEALEQPALEPINQTPKWVELSDVEIFDICPYAEYSNDEESFFRGARAAEKLLKEKNNA